jgi:hypothetical protein
MALAAIVLVAVLITIGLWLFSELRSTSILEDCLLQGRTNCAPIPRQGE